MEITMRLPEIDFTDTPTKTQMVNTLDDIAKFLNKVAGGMLAKGEYTATSPEMNYLLTSAVQVKAASDAFSGLANLPQPRPTSGPQVIR